MSGNNNGSGVNTIVLKDEEQRIFIKTVHKDNVRATIAYALLAIFALEVIAAFVMIIVVDDFSEKVREVLSIIFSPTVALVGAATGCYYGTRDSSDNFQNKE